VTGQNTLEIRGSLTLKGKSMPLVATAKYQLQGKQVVYEANFGLLRLDYGLGLVIGLIPRRYQMKCP